VILLHCFRIHYISGPLTQPGAPTSLSYDVLAEDASHAIEQFKFESSHESASIVSVTLDRHAHLSGELQREADGHGYLLRSEANCAWVTVDNAAVAIKRTDEGVVVDIFPLGVEDADSVAGTYAYSAELAAQAMSSATLSDSARAEHQRHSED